MMTNKDAMKLALEALEFDSHYGTGKQEAINALREALAEDVPEVGFGNTALDKMAENARDLGLDYEPAQQEPVAFLANGTRFKISYDNRQSGGQIHGIPPELGGRWVAFVAADDDCHLKLTSPPQRTWVGLTQDEFRDFATTYEYGTGGLIRAIEAKLRSKNEDRN